MKDRVHIVGAGPVGLVAALRMARTRRVVLHAPVLGDAEACGAAIVSIEAVPAGLLALLTEFGIHPRELGVDRLDARKQVAWESAAPECVFGPQVAHVERPRLEQALMRRVQTEPDIEVRWERRGALVAILSSPGEEAVFDATGRRALASGARHVLPGSPVARTWIRPGSPPDEQREFRMAALPDGYVYSVGSANAMLLGWCGSARLLTVPPDRWASLLHGVDAGWFSDASGMTTGNVQGDWRQAKTGAAGVQRSEGRPGVIALGDAAFGRDTLCSQGLALGISEAMYAAALTTDADRALWHEHRLAQYLSHLAHLEQSIRRCRFRESRFWRCYGDAVAAESMALRSRSVPRSARLTRGSVEATAVPSGPVP